MLASAAMDDDDELDEEERAALEAAIKKRKAKAQPASLEERIAERQAADNQRPVFVSKAQREAAAEEDAVEQAEIEVLMEEAEREQRQSYMQKVREDLRDQRVAEREGRPRGRNEPPATSAASADTVAVTKEDKDREKELQAIKDSCNRCPMLTPHACPRRRVAPSSMPARTGSAHAHGRAPRVCTRTVRRPRRQEEEEARGEDLRKVPLLL